MTGAALQSAATPTLGAASLSWLLRPAPTLRLPHGARPRTEGGLGQAGDKVKSFLGYILWLHFSNVKIFAFIYFFLSAAYR